MSIGRLEPRSVSEILIKSVSPKKIFNLLTEKQKENWYNIVLNKRNIFIELAGSKNAAEIFNIFGEDAVKAFIHQLKTDISADDEKILLWAIDKIFKTSTEFNVKISQSYLRPIYKAILNSKLSFKILNLLKENGYWHYFDKFTNDESELGAEMGNLGF